MIPKIIHLTWFSGDEFPPKLQKCIDTWKKLLPDFEIKLWTMEMARELNIQYVNEALDAKKWAFAGDVVRAYAVWKYGGVYMDTDILLLRRFDELMDKHMLFFMEFNPYHWKNYNPEGTFSPDGKCLNPNWYVLGRQIQAAMFMAEPGQKCLKDIIDFYRTLKFVDKNGYPNISLISPSIYAKVLEKYGFLYVDKVQNLNDNICIYPSSFVAACKYDAMPHTISIHLATNTWNPRSPWKRLKYFIRMTRFGAFINKVRYKL